MSDAVRAPLERFIRSVMLPSEYSATFGCAVQAQNSDGTLDVLPDDSRLPAHSRVKVKWGAPGFVAAMTPGARCLLAFEGGDPRKPTIVGFEFGNFSQLRLGATSGLGTEVAQSAVQQVS